ncbi:autophagy-related protein 101-like isoform X2 [Apostichopus japonicus]|uniref:autophagy-related protein 101-like isoform X2 n=1 Tax=Stichopus japonicus TaxID=307972 RepID=UPI003AB27B0D
MFKLHLYCSTYLRHCRGFPGLTTVESKQLEEVVNSIFHTILFHRTTGRFHYKQEGAFLIGTVGVVETDCDFVDMTYTRIFSSGHI